MFFSFSLFVLLSLSPVKLSWGRAVDRETTKKDNVRYVSESTTYAISTGNKITTDSSMDSDFVTRQIISKANEKCCVVYEQKLNDKEKTNEQQEQEDVQVGQNPSTSSQIDEKRKTEYAKEKDNSTKDSNLIEKLTTVDASILQKNKTSNKQITNEQVTANTNEEDPTFEHKTTINVINQFSTDKTTTQSKLISANHEDYKKKETYSLGVEQQTTEDTVPVVEKNTSSSNNRLLLDENRTNFTTGRLGEPHTSNTTFNNTTVPEVFVGFKRELNKEQKQANKKKEEGEKLIKQSEDFNTTQSAITISDKETVINKTAVQDGDYVSSVAIAVLQG